MLSNFMRVAIRNFMNQRLYSLINVIGLSSGLVCTLFIFLWVRDEVEKDRSYKDADKIYHVVCNMGSIGTDTITWITTPGLLGDAIREKVSGVTSTVRTMNNGPQLFEYGDKSFLEKGYYSDPEFFDIFNFRILNGQTSVESRSKDWTFISESLAQKLFGNEDPVGKHVRLGSKYDLTVAAVFENLPNESSFRFEFLIPLEIIREQQGTGFNWGNYNYPLYLKLADEKNLSLISHQINELQNQLVGAGETDEVTFYLQKFSDYYLHSNFSNGRPDGGRIKYVQIFSAVAVFILVIACINFMNMATARAVTRAKEVGVRKVVGAQRTSLIIQFIGESLLVSLLAIVIAVLATLLLLPSFNLLVSKQIVFDLSDPVVVMILIVTVLTTGVMAGSYPAFFLSSFQPGSVLKGSIAAGGAGGSLRRALVVFQFSLTVILTASALVVYNQIEFIRNTEIGYDRQSVISFSARGDLGKNFKSFRDELMQDPGVESISRASNSLVQVNNQNGSVIWPGKPANSQQFFRTVSVDIDFPETMGLELIEGRFFSVDFNDTLNFVITQKAVEVMGMARPIGQKITQWGFEGTIIGVVKDFHSQSMHTAMDPIILICNPKWTGLVFVKLKDEGQHESIARVENLFRKYNPSYPFEFSYIDDDFEKLYKNERITGSLAMSFTVMAIIISGLGLLGLAAYTAQKRKKEVSIRKTMGASVTAIVLMMSRGFVNLCLIAIVIGCPIAYLLMDKFLESFAYHTTLDWKIFAITSAAMLVLSLSVVIFQVFKVAVTNPVSALRNE